MLTQSQMQQIHWNINNDERLKTYIKGIAIYALGIVQEKRGKNLFSMDELQEEIIFPENEAQAMIKSLLENGYVEEVNDVRSVLNQRYRFVI